MSNTDDPIEALVHVEREVKETLPFVGKAAKVIQLYKQRRIHSWWKHFASRPAVDAHDVEDEIAAAIAEGDDRKIQAVLEGCRAAADAFDPIVLATIAMIGRKYERGEVPAWFQRASLAFLSAMSAEEFGDLRDLFHAIVDAIGSPGSELVSIWPKDPEWEIVPLGRGGASAMTLKLGLPNGLQLGGELKRRGFAQAALSASGLSPMGILMEMRVVRWFAETMPPARDPITT